MLQNTIQREAFRISTFNFSLLTLSLEEKVNSMKNMVYPEGYRSALSQRDTQRAIKIIKDTFQQALSRALNLLP